MEYFCSPNIYKLGEGIWGGEAITTLMAASGICSYSPGLTLHDPHTQVLGDKCTSCSAFGSVMKTLKED